MSFKQLGRLGEKSVLVQDCVLKDLPQLELRPFQRSFGVLLLLDGINWGDVEMRNAADHLMSSGAQHITVNGYRADDAHDLLDKVRETHDVAGGPVIMTSCIDGSESKALEYAAISAFPDPASSSAIAYVLIFRLSARSLANADIQAILRELNMGAGWDGDRGNNLGDCTVDLE